jgi:hypothetical protein
MAIFSIDIIPLWGTGHVKNPAPTVARFALALKGRNFHNRRSTTCGYENPAFQTVLPRRCGREGGFQSRSYGAHVSRH